MWHNFGTNPLDRLEKSGWAFLDPSSQRGPNWARVLDNEHLYHWSMKGYFSSLHFPQDHHNLKYGLIILHVTGLDLKRVNKLGRIEGLMHIHRTSGRLEAVYKMSLRWSFTLFQQTTLLWKGLTLIPSFSPLLYHVSQAHLRGGGVTSKNPGNNVR